ncbi:large ribosomal subunit protein mL41 isoform X2 [Halichoeres trimaculatus]|uniref:large ribosomal subunit protein mL41 isoform X2 n=1 Tax=Halichoeres trimaculatus TaxID=147232 RepID=UPI003D9F7406
MRSPVSQWLSIVLENWSHGTSCTGLTVCSRNTMGVLSTLMRGLVRGADRMSEFTSKRGSRTHNKGRGARPTGLRLSSRKFLSIRAMIPEFVVPNLEGFKLKPYVSYRTPTGTEPQVTAQSVFAEVVAPQIKKDFEEGKFNPYQLEKYGFNPTQKGKLFKLYPKNYVR